MNEHTYRVVVTREDGDWLADVPDLEGCHTFARSLAALDGHVREAIALTEDLPEGAEAGLRLVWDFRTGDPAIDTAAAVRAERERLEEQMQELVERTAQVARELVSTSRVSVRDAAALTGVSKARVSQVAPTPRKAQPRRRVPTPA